MDSQSVALWVRETNVLLTRLEDLLDAEFSALERRDSDEHLQIVRQKQGAIDVLAAREAQLRLTAQQDNQVSLQDFLRTLFVDAGLAAPDYVRFRELTRRCAEKNAVNGAIIEAKRSYTSKLLQILHGAADAAIYGRDARVAETSGSIRLGSA